MNARKSPPGGPNSLTSVLLLTAPMTSSHLRSCDHGLGPNAPRDFDRPCPFVPSLDPLFLGPHST
jgi:hypothetical protein